METLNILIGEELIKNQSIYLFKYFGISIFLIILSMLSVVTVFYFIRNISESIVLDGEKYIVKEIDNKNSESMGYLATYLIPFLFQNFSTTIEIITLMVLIFVIFQVYINSSLIIVNPFLNLWFNIYEIKMTNQNATVTKRAIILCAEKYLQTEDALRVMEIGTKLYFTIPESEREAIYERIK
jgi:hypothetical protein